MINSKIICPDCSYCFDGFDLEIDDVLNISASVHVFCRECGKEIGTFPLYCLKEKRDNSNDKTTD